MGGARRVASERHVADERLRNDGDVASSARPLAVVMVADPNAVTMGNLRRLAGWCDLVLTEATSSTDGSPRAPLRDGWRELLDLERPQLRVVTTQLGGQTKHLRQRVQRDSASPLLGMEPDDRPVLLVDADEFLEPGPVLAAIAEGVTEPKRLGLTPLYGAIDRIPPSIHCCWQKSRPDQRDPGWTPKRPYLFAGGSLSLAQHTRDQSPSAVRFTSPKMSPTMSFGSHVTMVEPTDRIAWKLANMRHHWDPRVMREQHLGTMLSAGVHHAGWWIADYREPEPWLLDLAHSAGLRIAGPRLPNEHLRALRAWSEARLDPAIPDIIVEATDAYVARRPIDATDFLPGLDDWLRQRPTVFNGHVTTDEDEDTDLEAKA
jgi:hypothetical protein